MENFSNLPQRKTHKTPFFSSPFLFNQVIYVVTQTSGDTGSAMRTSIFV